jgi:hypothetical protein
MAERPCKRALASRGRYDHRNACMLHHPRHCQLRHQSRRNCSNYCHSSRCCRHLSCSPNRWNLSFPPNCLQRPMSPHPKTTKRCCRYRIRPTRLRRQEAHTNIQRAAENTGERPPAKKMPWPKATKGRPGIKHNASSSKSVKLHGKCNE